MHSCFCAKTPKAPPGLSGRALGKDLQLFEKFQAFPAGIEPLGGVGTGPHRGLGLGGRLGPAAVFLGGKAQTAAECAAEIAVIGKSGGKTDVGHPHRTGVDELAGMVEPHRLHIFLKALVQTLADKIGHIVHGAALGLGEIRQPDGMHIVVVHKFQQPLVRTCASPLGA